MLPLTQPIETTMEDYRAAEIAALREYWLARWNELHGVHKLH